VAGHVYRRLDHIGEGGTGRRQRRPQVRHHLFGLPGHVTDRDRLTLLIERAGTGGGRIVPNVLRGTAAGSASAAVELLAGGVPGDDDDPWLVRELVAGVNRSGRSIR
jgi:hypothetical protein